MQSDEKHNIDDIFRRGLENLSSGESTKGDWDRMKNLIIKEGILKERKKYNWGAIALMSLFGAGIIFGTARYFTHEFTSSDSKPIITNTDAKENKKNEINEAPPIEAMSIATAEKTEPLLITKKRKTGERTEDIFLRNLPSSYDNGKLWTNRVAVEPVSEAKSIIPESEKISIINSPIKNQEELKSPTIKDASSIRRGKNKKSVEKKNEVAPTATTSNVIVNLTKDKTEAKVKVAHKKKESKKKDTNDNDHDKGEKTTSEKNYFTKKDVLVEKKENAYRADSIAYPRTIMDSEFTRIIPTKDPIDNNFSHFAVGACLSYNIDKYKIIQNTVADFYKPGDIQDEHLKGESNLTYSAGLIARYRFTYHLMLEAGAFYSQKRKVMYEANKVNLTKDSLATHYSNYTFSYNSRYIDIPIQAKGFIPVGMFNLQLAAGAMLSLNAPFGSKSFYSWQHVSDAPNAGNEIKRVFMNGKSIGVIPYGSIGINYVYNRKWEFFIEPGYKFNKKPLLQSNSAFPIIADHFLRTISIGFGAFHNF